MFKIVAVSDNNEKKITYQELNKNLKLAYQNNNYHQIINLSYAMIEDRLKTILDLLYVIEDRNKTPYPCDYIDRILRNLLNYNTEADKKKIYKINNISTKLIILEKILKSKSDNEYIKDCKKIIDKNIGINVLLNWIKEVKKWAKIRNEIIHSSFNKNIHSLVDNLEKCANDGYLLAKKIKTYTNKLKDNSNQLSVKTKWNSINELLNSEHIDEEIFNTFHTPILNYDILIPHLCFSEEKESEFILADDVGMTLESFDLTIDGYHYGPSEELCFFNNMKDKLLKTKNAFKDYSVFCLYNRNEYELDEIKVGKKLFKLDENELKNRIEENIVNYIKIAKKDWIYFSLEKIFDYVVSEKNRNDIELLKKVVELDSEVYNTLDIKYLNNKELLLIAIKNNEYNDKWFDFLNHEIINDKEIIIELLRRKHGDVFYKISDSLKNDEEVLKTMFYNCSYGEEFIEYLKNEHNDFYSKNIIKDYEKVMDKDVFDKNYGLIMMSDNLRDNKDVVMKYIVELSPFEYNYASNRLKNDKEVIITSIKYGIESWNLKHHNKSVFNDLDILCSFLNKENYDPVDINNYIAINESNIDIICNNLTLNNIQSFYYELLEEEKLNEIVLNDKIIKKTLEICKIFDNFDYFYSSYIQFLYRTFGKLPKKDYLITDLIENSFADFYSFDEEIGKLIENDKYVQQKIKEVLSNKSKIKKILDNHHPYIINYISKELRSDINFIAELLQYNSSVIDFLTEQEKDNDIIKKICEEKKIKAKNDPFFEVFGDDDLPF